MAERTMEQDMMGMMIAVMGIAIISQLLPGLAAPPTNRNVTVTLVNPPADAEMWQLGLCDWDITVAINQIGGLALVDVAEPITFEIPSGVQFPLRVVTLSVSKWIDFYGTPALQHLYEMQSIRPYLWDWDKQDWGDEPDPSYRAAFLNAFGSSPYDVQAESFITAEIMG